MNLEEEEIRNPQSGFRLKRKDMLISSLHIRKMDK